MASSRRMRIKTARSRYGPRNSVNCKKTCKSESVARGSTSRSSPPPVTRKKARSARNFRNHAAVVPKNSGKQVAAENEKQNLPSASSSRPRIAKTELKQSPVSSPKLTDVAKQKDESKAIPETSLSLPKSLQCGCGCLEQLAQHNQMALSMANEEAMRCRGDDTKSGKRKADDGNRRTHYGPEFEAFARDWCKLHLKAVAEKHKKKEEREKFTKMLDGGITYEGLLEGSSIDTVSGQPVSGRMRTTSSIKALAWRENDNKKKSPQESPTAEADYKVCMKGAGAILGVSMGFFYERSKRSQKSRIDEWAGEEADVGREILNVKDCCVGYDLCCIKEDVEFKTSNLLKLACCSGSPHNRQTCKLKQLLKDCPGLVQDWHDAYHMKHAVRGKTRLEQRAVIGEALHAGVCRNGIRMLLNSRVSSSRFQEIRVFIKKHGNSYRSLTSRSEPESDSDIGKRKRGKKCAGG